MLASALPMHGPGHVELVLSGVRKRLRESEYESVVLLKRSLSQ